MAIENPEKLFADIASVGKKGKFYFCRTFKHFTETGINKGMFIDRLWNTEIRYTDDMEPHLEFLHLPSIISGIFYISELLLIIFLF